MKIFRMIVITVFLFTSAVYGFFYFYNISRTDNSFPEIKFEGGIDGGDNVLEVSVSADEKALLKGVTAFDQKDGDLTNRVIIEQISNFIDKGVSKITYAVVDSDNHVDHKNRHIRYRNYESPHFTFSKAMRFVLGSNVNVLDIIGAQDTIDGDLSEKIKLTSSDLSVNTAGVYHMTAEVSNSKGDFKSLKFNVTIYEGALNSPQIMLKDNSYLIYKHIGDAFDAESYIEIPNGFKLDRIDSSVKTAEAGDYQVDYYVTDKNGMSAMTSLIVVVEE